jgi:molybdopterin molybdotransferase
MLTFEEARSRLLRSALAAQAGAGRISTERVPVADGLGRVLAEDLVARAPLPPFDNSAMDGYAVQVAALAGEGPWALDVVGESSAGRPAPPLRPGTTCRIFTGAAVPAGADAVVMQEEVVREGPRARFTAAVRPGQNIRRAGEDIAAGAVALAAGVRMSVGALALAAMIDRAEVAVATRPRVVVLCTGDELRPAGSPGRDATIPESNSAPLAALARQAGADVRVAPMVRDDPGAVDRALSDALEGTDVLVTVGGVSVGDHDVVRPAFERAGVTLDYWKVAIKPGKPLAVGSRGGTHVLGLPGNPASAIVTFALFGVPLLRALQGDARPLAPVLPVRLAVDRKRPKDRLELVRATLLVEEGVLLALPHDNQSSGAATSLASSDGLLMVPAGAGPVPRGAPLEFVRWGDV